MASTGSSAGGSRRPVVLLLLLPLFCFFVLFSTFFFFRPSHSLFSSFSSLLSPFSFVLSFFSSPLGVFFFPFPCFYRQNRGGRRGWGGHCAAASPPSLQHVESGLCRRLFEGVGVFFGRIEGGDKGRKKNHLLPLFRTSRGRR